MAVDLQRMVDLYLQAEIDVLAGKDVTLGGRRVTMEDLSKIIAGRKEWESRLRSARGSQGFALADMR